VTKKHCPIIALRMWMEKIEFLTINDPCQRLPKGFTSLSLWCVYMYVHICTYIQTLSLKAQYDILYRRLSVLCDNSYNYFLFPKLEVKLHAVDKNQNISSEWKILWTQLLSIIMTYTLNPPPHTYRHKIIK
jgi:hypothetical protein